MAHKNNSCSGHRCREVWLIVYFLHSRPGEQYAIVNKNRLVESSWQNPECGSLVAIKRKTRTTEAIVLNVSDDYDNLETNFESYVKVFEEDHGIRRQEIILTRNQETQTDPLPGILEQQNEKKAEAGLGTTIELDNILRKQQTAPRNHLSINVRLQQNHEENRIVTSNYTANANCGNSSSSEEGKTAPAHPPSLGGVTNMVPIGSGNTLVDRLVLESVNWNSHTTAVRKLLMAVFDRSTLATHSLTGKPSPAFLSANKPTKMQLDPVKVQDVVALVSAKCNVSESVVRSAITTKCADENKMYRKRKQKQNGAEQAKKTRSSY